MSSRLGKCLVVPALLSLGVWCGTAHEAAAQPAKGPAAKAPAAKGAPAAEGKRTKRGGRLPNHYADIVDEAQREKLYEIQAQFEPKLKQLRADLQAATAERDAALAKVLTPEQQAQVDKVKAEAKAKRAAARATAAGADQAKAGDAPAAKKGK